MNLQNNHLAMPQAYAVYLDTENPDAASLGRWSETCDLLVAHVRLLAQKADFDFENFFGELDALAVRAGLYRETDTAELMGQWLGQIDAAEHKPFVRFSFEAEDPAALCVPFAYWLYSADKTAVRTLLVNWSEAADVLLSLIRLRAQGASKVHQGFEDLITWLDDLAISKGHETVTPAVASSIQKKFGFDAFDFREGLQIAA